MMCFWAANCFCAREAGTSDGVVLFDEAMTWEDSALCADGRTIVRPCRGRGDERVELTQGVAG